MNPTAGSSFLLALLSSPWRLLQNFGRLFFPKRFQAHRVLGLAFLVQYALTVYLYLWDYQRYLSSPLVWSLPLNGLLQSINAALTFTFLPRREDSGFAAVADKSALSYYTVCENSFYAMQLLFVCCYLHHDIRPLIRRCVVVEPFFVFFVFYVRNLWPVSRIGSALKNDKNKSDGNRTKLIVSTYAIKLFYILSKHFVGFFPNYLIFLNRVTADDQHYLYGIQVLSAYACTISIFIHTLKFKGYIGPITAMLAYDIIIPGFLYLYFNMHKLIFRNLDVALVVAMGMLLNLVPPRKIWHSYQALVAVAMYAGLLPLGAS